MHIYTYTVIDTDTDTDTNIDTWHHASHSSIASIHASDISYSIHLVCTYRCICQNYMYNCIFHTQTHTSEYIFRYTTVNRGYLHLHIYIYICKYQRTWICSASSGTNIKKRIYTHIYTHTHIHVLMGMNLKLLLRARSDTRLEPHICDITYSYHIWLVNA